MLITEVSNVILSQSAESLMSPIDVDNFTVPILINGDFFGIHWYPPHQWHKPLGLVLLVKYSMCVFELLLAFSFQLYLA